ncbi:MAG: hypothetical protein BGN96_04290 [Bacteroidales bacterium 45-6]|nr:MAG: hypothetical protein BGN96_04290 [Bacteroidales bacterium 45-6]
MPRREEHGHTFAPEIELSIRLWRHTINGEEIIKRFGQEKNIAPTVQSGIRGQIPLAGIRTNTATSLPIPDKPLAAEKIHVYLMH